MDKQLLTVIVLSLLMTGTVQSATIDENSGAQASAQVTVDRPWYTSITVFLDESLPDSLIFIKDFWSWMVDSFFIDDGQQQDAQVIN